MKVEFAGLDSEVRAHGRVIYSLRHSLEAYTEVV